MTHLLTNHPIATHPIAPWLEHRMAQLEPLAPDRVRLVGLVIVDPLLADPDSGARASWIGDGATLGEVLHEHAAELDRFDAIAAVTWAGDRPLASVVIVNP